MSKTVLITGATSGFGYGIVESLLPLGFRVIATGRGLHQRTAVFSKLREAYPQNLIEKELDVTDQSQRQAITEFIKTLGGLDVLINNAGFGLFGPLETAEEEQLRQQMEVNFIAPTLLIRDFLPLLRKSKGHVINVTSVLGFLGFPLASLYCASKFALEGLTESLSYELAPHGVSFSVVQPGAFKTNFNQGMQWTTSELGKDSPYHTQLEGYKALRAKNHSITESQDPKVVIAEIVRLVQMKRPRYRSTLGKDALFSRCLRAILPSQQFNQLIKVSFQILFRRKSS